MAEDSMALGTYAAVFAPLEERPDVQRRSLVGSPTRSAWECCRTG